MPKNTYPRIQPKQAPAVPQFLPPNPLNAPLPIAPVVDKLFALNPVNIPIILMPKEEKGRWNIARLFDGVPMAGGFSHFDSFVAGTIARAAYTDNEDIHDAVQALLEAESWEERSYTVDGVAVKWYEYKTSAGVFVSIPGTTTFDQWVSYVKPFMKADATFDDVYVYQGIRKYLDAYVTKLDAVYGDDFYLANGGKVSVAGHSLGGCIAYWYGFRKNVLSAATLQNYARVKAVWTYGAPAFMLTTDEDRVMTGGMRVVRAINPGDPIPNLIQQTIDRLADVSPLTSLFTGLPPVHYATHSYLIDGRKPRAVQFFQSLDALRKGLIQSTAEQFRPHKIAEYCGGLERACLAKGDVPWPWYTYVVTLNRSLASIGK